jgi:hypothetical protein
LNDQLILVIDGRWLATGASHGRESRSHPTEHGVG